MTKRRTPYVERRGALYRVRFRIPADLACQTGLIEIRRSLQTNDPIKAQQRALAARLWFRDVVKLLRAMDAPSRLDLENAARAFFDRLVARVDVPRSFDGRIDDEIAWNLEETRARIASLEDQLRINQFGAGVQASAVEMLQSVSALLPQLSASLQTVSLQLAARAEREQMRYFEHQLTTPARPFEPDDQTFRKQGGHATTDVGSVHHRTGGATVAEGVKDYLRTKELTGLSRSHLDEIGRALAWFLEEIGENTPIESVQKAQLRSFRDNIRRIDVSLRGRNAKFASRLTDVRERQIKSVTSTRYWRSTQAFFRWAAEEGLAEHDPSQGLRIELRKGETKNSPEPFSELELRKLFHTPLYAGYLSPKRVSEPGDFFRRDGRWWSGVLPLFTGLRAGELSQLLANDFVFDDPVPHLKVREEDETGKRTKRAKTASSIRDVPLAPILLTLGLSEFVQERRKASPKERIFREFRLGAGDRLSDGMTKFWGRYLRKFGLHKLGRSTHVARHTIIARLRELGVPEEDIGALVGHAGRTITSSYGGAYPLSRKRATIEQLNYGFDVLSALGGPYNAARHALRPSE